MVRIEVQEMLLTTSDDNVDRALLYDALRLFRLSIQFVNLITHIYIGTTTSLPEKWVSESCCAVISTAMSVSASSSFACGEGARF